MKMKKKETKKGMEVEEGGNEMKGSKREQIVWGGKEEAEGGMKGRKEAD